MIRTFAIAATVAVSIASPMAVLAESDAGAYLAGRQAAMQGEFDAAARYYTRALARDRSNASLMEDAIVAQLASGQIERALPIAKILESDGQRSQAAHMVVIADMLKSGDYASFLERDVDRYGIGPLVDGLLQAWAHIGVGDREAAMAAFEDVGQDPSLRNFSSYHKGMALAYLGDFEAAEAVFGAQVDGGAMSTRRGAMARAEMLSQLGQNAKARATLEQAFGSATDPELAHLLDALQGDAPVPFSHVTSVDDGIAEVFFSLAGALRSEAGANYTLLYAQIALYLRPDHVDAILLGAELQEDMEQFDQAIALYKKVPQDHPAFHAAELGRAAALRQADKPNAAIEVLEQLARRFDDLSIVHSTLGDVLRQQDRFAEAVTAYDRALELSDDSTRGQWFLYYARAIAHERQGEWPKAEADFRKALDLNPDHPQVLNYLGYSLVEKRIKLDEALKMIETAVEGSPDSGYIVDSLGWVLYRLGRYEDAVVHMERAVELMPVDPVVNDHLGDVYWAVGRYREAEFQWKRALSFVDEGDTVTEADPARMRRKLEVGLDVVLEEEGAAPLKVAND